jgi:hypothetical protein
MNIFEDLNLTIYAALLGYRWDHAKHEWVSASSLTQESRGKSNES